MKKPIEGEWARYRVLLFPHASPEAAIALRVAFFSGVDALRTILFRDLEDTGDPNDVTDRDMALTEAIDAELKAFAAEVKAQAQRHAAKKGGRG